MEGLNQHGWECPDETAAESEMSEFLYAFVRLLKPKLVVETGCYKGFSTLLLGQAVCENKLGYVVSCDTDKECVAETRQKVRNLPVTVKHCSSLSLSELPKADFIFSDSGYEFRAREIASAKAGATVVVHDTRISYDTAIPPLENLVSSIGGICFETYRGFGIIKKTGEIA